jgi:hypothetical protein
MGEGGFFIIFILFAPSLYKISLVPRDIKYEHTVFNISTYRGFLAINIAQK